MPTKHVFETTHKQDKQAPLDKVLKYNWKQGIFLNSNVDLNTVLQDTFNFIKSLGYHWKFMKEFQIKFKNLNVGKEDKKYIKFGMRV